MIGSTYAHPWVLWGLLVLPLLVAYYWHQNRDGKRAVGHPSLGMLKGVGTSRYSWRDITLYALRLIAIAGLIVALARPQLRNDESKTITDAEGIDIVFAMDVSTSMLARDFTPDRIEAAKALGMEFVSSRLNDRMGLVAFAGEAYTLCPLTTDKATLLNQFASLSTDMLSDGTGIGIGLAMAVARLEESKATSRIIILLTDGLNNTGEIPPAMASELARTFGIRVYTIGVGTTGEAPYPISTPLGIRYRTMPVELDEPQLRTIAQQTGGEYFRATDNEALRNIYAQIDQLEKSKVRIEQRTHIREGFAPWLALALISLALEQLLALFVFRRLP